MFTLRRKANIGRPYMSQLILMIGRIDDLDNPEALTEVWRRAMPVVELSRMRPEHYLNGLENDVMEVGWEAMRTLMVEQWRLSDEVLVRRFRQEQAGATVGDGYDRLKVASRLGVVHLPRQVCYLAGADRHPLPGNAGLPEHEGQVTTRGLQEGVCLLPQELPFGTAERLLGWMAHDPEVMSETQSRRWVCRHGEIIRQAERAEVKALQKRPDLNGLKAQLQEAGEPRRPAAWAAELNQAVETALAKLTLSRPQTSGPPIGNGRWPSGEPTPWLKRTTCVAWGLKSRPEKWSPVWTKSSFAAPKNGVFWTWERPLCAPPAATAI